MTAIGGAAVAAVATLGVPAWAAGAIGAATGFAVDYALNIAGEHIKSTYGAFVDGAYANAPAIQSQIDLVNFFNQAFGARPFHPDFLSQCFTGNVCITMHDQDEPVEIKNIRIGDIVLSFDASGALVPGRVTQLLHNVTETWLHLSNGTYVTPGHRYLRPDGSFAEI